MTQQIDKVVEEARLLFDDGETTSEQILNFWDKNMLQIFCGFYAIQKSHESEKRWSDI